MAAGDVKKKGGKNEKNARKLPRIDGVEFPDRKPDVPATDVEFQSENTGDTRGLENLLHPGSLLGEPGGAAEQRRTVRERETGEQDPNAPPWSDSEGTPGRRGGRLGPPTSPHQGGAEALPKTPPVPEACECFGRKVTTKSLRRNQKTKQMKRKKAIGQLQKTNELGERVRNLKHRLSRMDQNGSIEQRHTTRSEMQAASSKKNHLEEPEAIYLGKGKETRRGGVRLI